MKVHILGTAGFHPNEKRHTTCLAIPECGIVFDAGTSIFRLRDRLVTDELQLFLSHAHLDHVVGLTYLLDVVRDKPMQRVRVYGQPQKLKAVTEHLFHPELFPVEPPFECVPLETNVSVPQGGVVTHCNLVHPRGSVGYRIDWPDRSLAYITDTTASQDSDYLDFIRGVDLLLHECNFPDGNDEIARITGHSCTSAVATVAQKSQVGRLVMIHFDPMIESSDPIGIDAAKKIFANTLVANDNDVIEF